MYGQVVVGPPGSGKTTYCNGMQQYLRLIGRETLVINLDPANEYHDTTTTNDTTTNNNDTTNDNTNTTHLPYDVILDTSEEIINVSTVMEELNLGPNGGLIYCLEYIQHHIQTFISILQSKLDSYYNTTTTTNDTTTNSNNNNQQQNIAPPYLLFDLPGQVELYTHSNTIQTILTTLIKHFDIRLVMVQLIDSHHCMDVYKFISSALLSTTTMLRLELPAVNVLSKIDLLKTMYHNTGNDNDDNNNNDDNSMDIHGMPFNLDFFMECQDLDRLLPYLHQQQQQSSSSSSLTYHQQEILENDHEYQLIKMKAIHNNKFSKKYYKLHHELCDVINDFSLLSYIPLDINDAESVGRVVARIDKSNGYVFVSNSIYNNNNNIHSKEDNMMKSNVEDMFQCAMQVDNDWGYEQIADVQEKYLNIYQDDVPELRKEKK